MPSLERKHELPGAQSAFWEHSLRQRPNRHTSPLVHSLERVQLTPTLALDWQPASHKQPKNKRR